MEYWLVQRLSLRGEREENIWEKSSKKLFLIWVSKRSQCYDMRTSCSGILNQLKGLSGIHSLKQLFHRPLMRLKVREKPTYFLTQLLCVLLSVNHSAVFDSLQSHGLYSPPGSSVHWTLQAKVGKNTEAIPFSRGSSQPRDRTQVSWLAGRFFTICCC